MRINVTQADIDNGIRRDCCHCPVVLATARALPELAGYLSADCETIGTATRLTAYTDPKPVAAFIVAFDAGRPVAPFHFDLPALSLWRNVR